jgi:hypothetical protein
MLTWVKLLVSGECAREKWCGGHLSLGKRLRLISRCNRNRGSRLYPEAGGFRVFLVARTFRVGDHVSWNSEAGRVRGTILRVHKKDVNYKGYVHHASPDDPQYEIRSDKTDHVALHKGRALRRLSS